MFQFIIIWSHQEQTKKTLAYNTNTQQQQQQH